MGIWWLMVVLLCMASSISGADFFAVKELTRDSPERIMASVPDYQDLTESDTDLALRRLYNFLRIERPRKRAAGVCVNAHGLNFLCNNQEAYDALNLGHESPGRRRRTATLPDQDK